MHYMWKILTPLNSLPGHKSGATHINISSASRLHNYPFSGGIPCLHFALAYIAGHVNIQRQRKDELKDFKAAIKDSFVSFGAPRRVNKNKIIVNKQGKKSKQLFEIYRYTLLLIHLG